MKEQPTRSSLPSDNGERDGTRQLIEEMKQKPQSPYMKALIAAAEKAAAEDE